MSPLPGLTAAAHQGALGAHGAAQPWIGDSRKLRLPLSSLGQRKGKGTDETGRLPVACLALPRDVTCHGVQEGPGCR